YVRDEDRSMEDIAFDFFMLNRMNVSGIVKGGPIGGYSQSGKYNIGARFNKDELIRRIDAIAARSDSIMVRNDEGSHFCSRL
ncbi:DNA adenine methylase, partial [Citrobacter sp. AAK_AS5]